MHVPALLHVKRADVFMSRALKVDGIQMTLWGSSLVDMLANCGSMEDAWRVFNKMPSQNVITWNALLGGCAMHGHGKENLKHLNGCVRKVYSWVMSLIFVFCQLVAMQVWWMEACVVMLR
jgi:pentatricopeptide repeat protein